MKPRAIAFALACGCGPQVAATDDGDTNGADTSASTTGVATSDAPTTDTPTTDVPTTDPVTTDAPDTGATDATTSTTGDEGEESDFIGLVDQSSDFTMCDPWVQDCPRGQKCMPYSIDGSSSWNATKCTPIADDPNEDGEACSAFEGPFGGVDDCSAISMCFWVDAETNVGECVAFCVGTLEFPSCADGVTTCTLPSDGLPAVCLPLCDPLAQDCAAGSGCYFVHDHFECDPDVSGASGAPGDACDAAGECDPGAVCVLGTAVPNCATQTCCASFCDLTAPSCTDGLECTPWHDDGEAPPGEENIGACLLPEGG